MTTLMMSMPNHRKGFTLVEVTVVSVLMAVLAVLLSSAWVGVGRTAADLIGRSQLVQERDMAVAALSRDLGGCSVEPDARTGEKINGRWLKWEYPNNDSLPSNQDLKLYYDGGTDSSGDPLANTVVHYLVASDPDPNVSTLILVRRKTVNGGTPTDFTVARNVYSMTVTPDTRQQCSQDRAVFQVPHTHAHVRSDCETTVQSVRAKPCPGRLTTTQIRERLQDRDPTLAKPARLCAGDGAPVQRAVPHAAGRGVAADGRRDSRRHGSRGAGSAR